MTVKDAVSVLRDATHIGINWGGLVTHIDPENALEMDAYGDYKVDFIRQGYQRDGEENFEIGIAVRPIKEEEE